MDSLIFLGTGDAMGVPRVYCSCEICEEARNTGNNRRLRSSVLVQGRDDSFLIDCGPDWRSQVEALGQRITHRILVTHAHFDHIGGLPEWADACRWMREKGELYAPQEVIDTIQRQFPWVPRHLHMIPVDGGVEVDGWRISTWKVTHGANGFSHAYRLEKDGFRWVYCSDSIGLSGEEKKLLFGLNLLVLGTSFFHETASFPTRSVYDMKEAEVLLDEIKPDKTVYTHMSHDIDINRAYPLPPNVTLARTGLKVELG